MGELEARWVVPRELREISGPYYDCTDGHNALTVLDANKLVNETFVGKLCKQGCNEVNPPVYDNEAI